MSRVINLDSAGKDRVRLTKSVVIAIRELAKQNEAGAEARDLAAFIVFALESIAAGIDASVVAWEKRGYWIKADRFRMEWAWAATFGQKMRAALLEDDWAGVASVAAQVAQKLNGVKVSANHRLGTPWVGAWQQLQRQR